MSDKFSPSNEPLRNDTDTIAIRRSRTKKWKLLVLFCIMLLLICLALIVGIIVISKERNSLSAGMKQHAVVCRTEGCVKLAAYVMDSLNQSANPCIDAYQYICGGWTSKTVIPDDKSHYNVLFQLEKNMEINLKSLAESNDKVLSFSKSTRWVKQVYNACMNKTQISSHGAKPIKEILAELTGWTLGKAESDNRKSWTQIMADIRLLDPGPYGPIWDSIGAGFIVSAYVSADLKDTSKNILYLDQPLLGLPTKSYYLPKRKTIHNMSCNVDVAACQQIMDPKDTRTEDKIFWQDKTISAYLTYAKTLSELVGINDSSLAEAELMEMIKFEAHLANATVPDTLRKNKTNTYNPTTVGELKLSYPNVDWNTYLDTLFNENTNGRKLSDDQKVVVQEPHYFKELDKVLQNKNTDKGRKLVKNYLCFRFIKSVAGHLNNDFSNANLEFRKTLTGVETKAPRWKQCIKFTNTKLGMAFGKIYTSKHFTKEDKSKAIDIIDEIHYTFVRLFNKIDWFDDETRRKSMEKLTTMQSHIGYPELLNSPDTLDAEYKDLDLAYDDHFKNVMHILKWEGQYNLKQLGKRVDKSKWIAKPAEINAFYHPAKNSITFPAGIFQLPMYVSDGPMSVNFGGIGYAIGHEITHGFDDQGRQTDKDGHLTQWWSQSAIDTFVNKTKCMIDQYDRYFYDIEGQRVYLNGTSTLGENIADNVGMRQAFLAYREWVQKNGEELKLPGLEHFSHNQLFFLNPTACGMMRPEVVRLTIKTDYHSPWQNRVIGMNANHEEYANAFQCPVGSPMNPKEKCGVFE